MPETFGLDIGSHSMKLVGLNVTSKGYSLTHAGVKEIPSEIDNEDVSHCSEILKALTRETGIKPAKVRLTVSGDGVNVKRVTMPSMPKADLQEAARWEIKNDLPFPVDSAKIDLHIVDESEQDNVKKLDLIVVACPNHLIERTLSIAKGAGFKPTHLDVGPFALWNAWLTWDRSEEAKVIALIDLGADRTGINLFEDGVLQLCREVTPAGADITRSIMEGIGFDEEPDHLYERIERIKQTVGIPSEDNNEGIIDESIDLAKISFLVRPVMEKLAAEIQRSLDYCMNQFHWDRIDKILLTGGGANLKNIATYLADELRLPIERFNPFDGGISLDSKNIDAEVLDQGGSIFTVAAGVALPEPKRIELLPAKESFFSRARVEKFIPILAPLMALLIFLWIIWGMNRQMATIKKEHEAKMGKVAILETLQSKIITFKEKEKQIQQALSLLPASVIVPVPSPEILKEISHIMPKNCTLTLLSVKYKEKPAKEESQLKGEWGLHLEGLAFGKDLTRITALANIIDRLEKSPLFENVQLVSADENKSYNRSGVTFEIVSAIDHDGQKEKKGL